MVASSAAAEHRMLHVTGRISRIASAAPSAQPHSKWFALLDLTVTRQLATTRWCCAAAGGGGGSHLRVPGRRAARRQRDVHHQVRRPKPNDAFWLWMCVCV